MVLGNGWIGWACYAYRFLNIVAHFKYRTSLQNSESLLHFLSAQCNLLCVSRSTKHGRQPEESDRVQNSFIPELSDIIMGTIHRIYCHYISKGNKEIYP